MSNELQKALDLAKLGVHVFPISRSKTPYKGSRGFKDATTDPDVIRAGWAEHPTALVGYWTEPSGVVVLDIDLDEAKGKDGYKSLAFAGIEYASPVYYDTPSGGQHVLYKAPTNPPGPATGVAGLPGVDRRSGGSLGIWYGKVPATLDGLPDAPEWLAKGRTGATVRTSDAAPYTGDISSWVAALSGGEPITAPGGPEHYGDMFNAVGDVVWQTYCDPTGPNRPRLDWVTAAYLSSAATSVPEDDRSRKVVDALRWWIGVYEAEFNRDAVLWAVGTVKAPPSAALLGMWDARPDLKAIRSLARQTTTSPWALLGAVIHRTLHSVPYYVQYRSYLGGASLNSLHAYVGPTGGSKSMTQRVVSNGFKFHDALTWEGPVEAGSGEAIPDWYRQKVRKEIPGTGKTELVAEWRNANRAHLWAFDEVGMLDARSSRQGSTLVETMKQGWSGEVLGRVLKGGEGTMLDQDSYRFGLFINVQPARADLLFSPSAVAGGLPSRFVFYNTQVPNAREEAEEPTGIVYEFPRVAWDGITEIRALPVMDRASQESLFSAHEGKVDELDSHAVLTRCKIACALAVMAGRYFLKEEDWEIAGAVMEHSDETRASIRTALKSAKAKANYAEGKATGVRNSVAEEVQVDRKLKRIIDRIRKQRAEGIPDLGKGGIKQMLPGRDRQFFDEACEIIRKEDSK